MELETPDRAEIVNGKIKDKLGHLEDRNNKLGQVFMLASPTDNRSRMEKTIKAPSGAKLIMHIRSERAGSIHKDIFLD